MSEAPAAPAAPTRASAATSFLNTPEAPWWVPGWPQILAGGLYVMTFWLLYVLSPAQGTEPSDLFKTLAGAVVLTAFVNGVVAAVFTASRDSQKKNDTIAAQAKAIANASTPPSP